MKFKVSFSRIGCLWDFVEHLTLWHYSYKLDEPEAWIKQTGKLTDREQAALKSIARVAKAYNEGSKTGESWLLDRAFIAGAEKSAWARVKAQMPKEEFDELKASVSLLEKRFDTIWPDNEKRLIKRQEILEQGLTTKQGKEAAEILSTFFKPANEPESIQIYLLTNAMAGHMQGGANLGVGEISLRCSRTEPMSFQRLAGVVWHEAAHLYQQDYYLNLEREFEARVERPEFWENNYELYSIFREATVSALVWPYGSIAQQLLDFPKPNIERDYGSGYAKIDPKSMGDWGYVFAPIECKRLLSNM